MKESSTKSLVESLTEVLFIPSAGPAGFKDIQTVVGPDTMAACGKALEIWRAAYDRKSGRGIDMGIIVTAGDNSPGVEMGRIIENCLREWSKLVRPYLIVRKPEFAARDCEAQELVSFLSENPNVKTVTIVAVSRIAEHFSRLLRFYFALLPREISLRIEICASAPAPVLAS